MHTPLTIGLVQLTIQGTNFLPYVCGILQTYVQHYSPNPERYQFLTHVYKAESVAMIATRLESADIVGFSLYMWSSRRSLAVAQRLKQTRPERLIIVGGPNVPQQAENFLREHPYIDVCVHGEGEETFLQLLETFPPKKWDVIPGLSWRDDNGHFHHTPAAGRRKDLDSLPSPYLTDVFLPLLHKEPEAQWVALWETNRGCPFSCSFCDWGSATRSKVYGFALERLQQELEWFAAQKIHSIFCCDANFGILPRDLEIARYAAALKQRTEYPKMLSVQNAKNATERAYEVHRTLIAAGLDTSVTLSLQSVDPTTLKAVKRDNISLDTFHELHRRFRREGVATYTDVIIGLPGETYTSFSQGMVRLMEHGQYRTLQLHTALLLPNAELSQPAVRAQYGIQSVWVPSVAVRSPAAEPPDGLYEMAEIVVGTAAMPPEDWVKTRAFAWLAGALFYDSKLLKAAFMALHHLYGIDYLPLFEAFLDPPPELPTLRKMVNFLFTKARAVQQGEIEYCRQLGTPIPEVWWSVDAFVGLQLIAQREVQPFFEEAEYLIKRHLRGLKIEVPTDLLHDWIEAGKILLGLTYRVAPLQAQFVYNTPELYRSLLRGEYLDPQPLPRTYIKPWEGAPHLLANPETRGLIAFEVQ